MTKSLTIKNQKVMENNFKKKIDILRGEMIGCITENTMEKGTVCGNGDTELFLYDGDGFGEDLYLHFDGFPRALSIVCSNDKQAVSVKTYDEMLPLSEISTDDMRDIATHIISMTREDIKRCKKWAWELGICESEELAESDIDEMDMSELNDIELDTDHYYQWKGVYLDDDLDEEEKTERLREIVKDQFFG